MESTHYMLESDTIKYMESLLSINGKLTFHEGRSQFEK